MLDISGFFSDIQSIILYIVPGYMSISVKRHYRQEFNHEEKHLYLLSITYSFVFKMLVDTFVEVYNKVSPEGNKIELTIQMYIAIILLLALLWSYIITCSPDWKISDWIRKSIFKTNTEPFATVWNKSMRSQEGTWARVYLNEKDMLYVGQLLDYTANPNIEKREIRLRCFSSYKLSSNELIENHENNEKASVWIPIPEGTVIELFEEGYCEVERST